MRLPLIPTIALIASLMPCAAHAQTIPHYAVLFSAEITAGPYSGDYDIFGNGFTLQGLIDNSSDQLRAVSSLGTRETNPVAIPDNQGGYIVAYTLEHSDSAHRGDRDIVMRRINHDGVNIWGDSINHVAVVAQTNYIEQNPRLTLLPDGSLLVCYEIHYGTAPGSDVDIAAARFGPDGRSLWPHAQWVASSSKRVELLRDLISDGTGGAVALVESHTYKDSLLAGSDILVQHIDSSARTGWKDSDQPAIVAASPYLETNPVMVSDGDGGVYVAYQLEYTKGSREGDLDVLAQHVTRFGSRTWTDEANPPVVSSNAKSKEKCPTIARDSNGIVVAFEMSFIPTKGKGTAMAHVIGMQRLDSNGRPAWNSGKKSSLISLARMSVDRPQLLPGPLGGVYLLFEATDTLSRNRDIYAQRIAANGDQVWGDGERPIEVFHSPDIESDASAIPDGLSGLIIVARRRPVDSDKSGPCAIIAQRIGVDGASSWEDIQPVLTIAASATDASAPVVVQQ